jgi:hypothetical protein
MAGNLDLVVPVPILALATLTEDQKKAIVAFPTTEWTPLALQKRSKTNLKWETFRGICLLLCRAWLTQKGIEEVSVAQFERLLSYPNSKAGAFVADWWKKVFAENGLTGSDTDGKLQALTPELVLNMPDYVASKTTVFVEDKDVLKACKQCIFGAHLWLLPYISLSDQDDHDLKDRLESYLEVIDAVKKNAGFTVNSLLVTLPIDPDVGLIRTSKSELFLASTTGNAIEEKDERENVSILAAYIALVWKPRSAHFISKLEYINDEPASTLQIYTKGDAGALAAMARVITRGAVDRVVQGVLRATTPTPGP